MADGTLCRGRQGEPTRAGTRERDRTDLRLSLRPSFQPCLLFPSYFLRLTCGDTEKSKFQATVKEGGKRGRPVFTNVLPLSLFSLLDGFLTFEFSCLVVLENKQWNRIFVHGILYCIKNCWKCFLLCEIHDSGIRIKFLCEVIKLIASCNILFHCVFSIIQCNRHK